MITLCIKRWSLLDLSLCIYFKGLKTVFFCIVFFFFWLVTTTLYHSFFVYCCWHVPCTVPFTHFKELGTSIDHDIFTGSYYTCSDILIWSFEWLCSRFITQLEPMAPKGYLRSSYSLCLPALHQTIYLSLRSSASTTTPYVFLSKGVVANHKWNKLSWNMTKPTKWSLHPAKTPISLGFLQVC